MFAWSYPDSHLFHLCKGAFSPKILWQQWQTTQTFENLYAVDDGSDSAYQPYFEFESIPRYEFGHNQELFRTVDKSENFQPDVKL